MLKNWKLARQSLFVYQLGKRNNAHVRFYGEDDVRSLNSHASNLHSQSF